MAQTAESPTALRKTALNATHRAHKAKMVDFGGWDMPVEYSGLIAEHMAVRTAVGLFDVSHMGDIQLRGPGSLAAVQRLCMNDASKLASRPGPLLRHALPQRHLRRRRHRPQARRERLPHRHQRRHPREGRPVGPPDQVGRMPCVHINDFSDYYTQLAIQGPRAEETLQKLTDDRPRRHQELLVHLGQGLRPPQRHDRPHRLHRRRRLRDLHPLRRTHQRTASGTKSSTPAQSSASSPAASAPATPSASKPPWPSTATRSPTPSTSSKPTSAATPSSTKALDSSAAKRLLAIQNAGGPTRKLVGLEMIERGIGRDGYPVTTLDGQRIGEITSGSPAPFLKKNIALAYVPTSTRHPRHRARRRDPRPARPSPSRPHPLLQAPQETHTHPIAPGPSLEPQRARHSERSEESQYFARPTKDLQSHLPPPPAPHHRRVRSSCERHGLMDRRQFVTTSLAAAAGNALLSPRAPAQTPPATQFPPDFLWGMATASYQVEGA